MKYMTELSFRCFSNPSLDEHNAVLARQSENRETSKPAEPSGVGSPIRSCSMKRALERLGLVSLCMLVVGDTVGQDDAVPAVSGVSMFTAPASGDTYQFGVPIEVRVDSTGSSPSPVLPGSSSRWAATRAPWGSRIARDPSPAPARCSSGTRWWRRTATPTGSAWRRMRSG